MKVAVHGAERRVAAIVDDLVVDLNLAHAVLIETRGGKDRAVAASSQQVPPEIGDFIRSGRAGLDAAAEALASIDIADTARTFAGRPVSCPLEQTTLHPPLSSTARLFMAMGNYPDHVANFFRRRDGRSTTLREATDEIRSLGPSHFVKHRDNVVASGAGVRYPARTSELDFEGEVAVVLASSFIDLDEQDFAGCVWGVSLVNDWSIRDYANRVRDFGYSKNFDTSCTVGPWITVNEVDDVDAVPFTTTVNGSLRQAGNTRDMAFSFADLANYLSRDMTLRAGDLISGGTCAGTGADIGDDELAMLPGQNRFVEVGDVVEVSSPLLGSIRNRILRKGTE